MITIKISWRKILFSKSSKFICLEIAQSPAAQYFPRVMREASMYHLSLHWTDLKPYLRKNLHRSHNFLHCHAFFQCGFAKNTHLNIFAKIHKEILFPRWLTLLHVGFWTRTPPARHLVVLLWLKSWLQGKLLGNYKRKRFWNPIIRLRPRLHVFGHIHEAHGSLESRGTLYVNASSRRPRL